MPKSNLSGRQLLVMWGVDAKQGLYRQDGKWYHQLKEFPGVLFDENGYLLFQTRESYFNNPYLQIKQDLNIPLGISNIPGYVRVTENGQIKELTQASIKAEQHPTPKRAQYQGQRIVRDSAIIHRIKSLYDYKCQLCGTSIQINRSNLFYAEGHHIMPLGTPHNGPDVIENILCVCPNHHVQLDYGAIPLELSKLFFSPLHKINPEYINYHNSTIYDGFTVFHE